MTAAFIQVRMAVRSLLRSPMTSLSIIATLAIGVAALTAVFSVVYGVLVRGLPYREPDRLVWISSVRTDRPDAPFTLPELMDLRERARALEIAAYANWSASLATTAVAQRLQGLRISANAFEVLGVRATAGRLLQPSDDRVDALPVALLGFGLWQRQFAGDPNAVGRVVQLNGEPYTVVGVLPRLLPLPNRDIDVVVPLSPDRDPRRHLRGSVNFLRLFGRVRGTASAATAERELTALTTELRTQYPVEYARKLGVRLAPLQKYLVGDHRQTLLVLLGCAVLLLGVALANILNLLMIRAMVRQGEVAVRRALGATMRHIATTLMTEGAVLSTIGGAIGALLAYWAVAVLATGAFDLPRLDEVRVDFSALVFTAAFQLIAVALFSLAPLAVALRSSPQTALRAAGRANAGTPAQRRVRAAFVVTEIALAVVLTTATATLLESLVRLQRLEPGYRADSVFVARLSLPQTRYADAVAMTRFHDRLKAALTSHPAVAEVGVVSVAPLSGLLAAVPYSVVGRPLASRFDWPTANYRVITPGYFAAIRASIVAGRSFSDADDIDGQHVAIVSRALAAQQMPGLDPIGQQLLVDDNNQRPRPVTVVGVVRDFRHVDLDGAPSPDIYIPLQQVNRDAAGLISNSQFWTVRVRGNPATFGPTFLNDVQSVDPAVAASGIGPMEGYVERSLATRRLSVTMLLGFALVALVLSTIGVYGVMAYSVELRRREIGVRLALGSSPNGVVRFVLRHAIVLSSLGLAIGIAGALLSGRALSGMLFGVSPNDPVILTLVALALLAMSMVASWIPARRAARIDPVTALSGS